jgi:hypothetical protein
MSDTATAAAPKTQAQPKPAAAPSPEAAVTAALKEMPRHFKPLVQGRLFVAHSSEGKCGNIWSATLDKDTPFEDCLNDEFWANKAADMHVGDRIWVASDNETFDAELRVTSLRTVGAGVVYNRASVAVLRHTDLSPPKDYVDIGDHEIEFKGQHLKWCIVRRADKSIAREGFETRQDAERMRTTVSLAKTGKK